MKLPEVIRNLGRREDHPTKINWLIDATPTDTENLRLYIMSGMDEFNGISRLMILQENHILREHREHGGPDSDTHGLSGWYTLPARNLVETRDTLARPIEIETEERERFYVTLRTLSNILAKDLEDDAKGRIISGVVQIQMQNDMLNEAALNNPRRFIDLTTELSMSWVGSPVNRHALECGRKRWHSLYDSLH
jgi:hypothetical protein